MSPYYQPSNKMPPAGMLLLLLGGVVAAAVLALVYIYAIWYIPFLHVNLLVCMGFGFGLGLALRWLVRVGKLRNPAMVGWLALAVGLVALYLEWGVFLTLLLNSETTGTGTNADTSTSFSPTLFFSVLTHPAQMWDAIRQVNETGTWSLKGTTPSGIFLWLIWLIEAGIIVSLSYFLPPIQARAPFSETTDTWATDEVLPQQLSYVTSTPALRQSLESGHFDTLTPYNPSDSTANFARLTLHKAPDDDNCQYLSLENVTITLDKKGKPQESASTLVPHLAISAGTYRQLRSRFGTVSAASIGASEAADKQTY